MARISYPDASRYERDPLAKRIKLERGGKLLNLYRMPLHVVELTATIAAYTCVSRFLEALDIDPE